MQNNLQLSVDSTLASRGIKVRVAVCHVPEVIRRRGSDFKEHVKLVLEKLDIPHLLDSPIIKAYRQFHEEAGILDGLPPAEHLLKIIQRSGMLPNINRVVDCYNLVSVETLLSIGAHNLAHIKGSVTFRTTDGTERYTPLGKSEPEKVGAGEYACMDAEKILCRLDLKQCDETKVGESTRDFMVYV